MQPCQERTTQQHNAASARAHTHERRHRRQHANRARGVAYVIACRYTLVNRGEAGSRSSAQRHKRATRFLGLAIRVPAPQRLSRRHCKLSIILFSPHHHSLSITFSISPTSPIAMTAWRNYSSSCKPNAEPTNTALRVPAPVQAADHGAQGQRQSSGLPFVGLSDVLVCSRAFPSSAWLESDNSSHAKESGRSAAS